MGNWTEETMRLAIKEVKKGNDSMRKVGEKYNIPASSIRDWISGKTSSKKKGPRTVLSQEEEHDIVNWCLQTQQTSHGITFYMLRRKVADICQGRETPFKDGVPGKRWLEWFKKRHPCVSIEPAHALKGKRRPESERETLAGKKKKLPWSLPMTPPMMPLPMSLPLSEGDGFAIVARDPYDGQSEVPTLNMQESQDMLALPQIQSAEDTGMTAVKDGTEMTAVKDGMEMMAVKDGTEMMAVKDGTEMMAVKDGTEMMAVKDGTEMTAVEDGTEMAAVKDGIEMMAVNNGTEMTAVNNGTEMTAVNDGMEISTGMEIAT